MSDGIESLLADIVRGDFTRFDQEVTERTARAAEAKAHATSERRLLAAAAARLAATEDGRALLQWICDRTLNRVTFLVVPGLPADQVALLGAKREGANELAFEVFRLVAEGRGGTVTPRT